MIELLMRLLGTNNALYAIGYFTDLTAKVVESLRRFGQNEPLENDWPNLHRLCRILLELARHFKEDDINQSPSIYKEASDIRIALIFSGLSRTKTYVVDSPDALEKTTLALLAAATELSRLGEQPIPSQQLRKIKQYQVFIDLVSRLRF